VICTFVSNTEGSCWVGDKDYVTGDPSNTAGVTSTSGKVKFFAGRRSDPFFFNLQGFRNAVATVEAAVGAGGVQFNTQGCPTLNAQTAGALVTTLGEKNHVPNAAPCPADQEDCFGGLNAIVLVLQIDKSLFNSGTNTALGVWGSTHATP